MRIAAAHLRDVSAALVRALGADAEEAGLVADNLVMADMRGIPTHGVLFLPLLAARVEAGMVTIPTALKILRDDGAAVHIDGGNGLGQSAAAKAMRMSIVKARAHGIGMGLVRHTNHIGLLAFYALMAAAEDMVGFCTCNGAASVAPWGGAEPFFGSNPFAVAAPSGSATPVVLDMSTTIVARGKIRRAQRLKERIPSGWALDAGGAPTEDPDAAMKGTLLPIGGPKGSGMAFFIDLVCGLLSGSSYARELKSFHQLEGPTGVGVMTLAIDISRFMPPSRFATLAGEHIRSIRGSRRAAGADRIRMPGEIEAEQ